MEWRNVMFIYCAEQICSAIQKVVNSRDLFGDLEQRRLSALEGCMH